MPSNSKSNEFTFAVIRQDLLSSNSWKVVVDKKGNAYICCRDTMKEIKTSLHKSGKQHVAFTSETKLLTTYGSRFLHKMEEPQTYVGPELTPSFNLIFPSWGLSLSPKIRQADPTTWNNQVSFIAAAQEPLATTLSFVIVDSALDLKSATYDDPSIVTVTSLDLRLGKKLLVVRRYEDDGQLRQLAIDTVDDANRNAEAIAESLDSDRSDTPFLLRVDGRNVRGIPYTMPFTVSLMEGCPVERPQLAAPFSAGPVSAASS